MMVEVQKHGFSFEEWVRNQFFDGYQATSYTGHWDVPAEANLRLGGLPVSIKTAKYGSPIGLGDALRQFNVREDFLLIVGYWKQEGPNKRFVNTVAATIRSNLWRSIWSPITQDDLQRLDGTIKDRSIGYREARIRAQKIKSASPFADVAITLNPKIDSKVQRRLQCSISFKLMFDRLVPGANGGKIENPELFGVKVMKPFPSGPRKFHRNSRKKLQDLLRLRNGLNR